MTDECRYRSRARVVILRGRGEDGPPTPHETRGKLEAKETACVTDASEAVRLNNGSDR